MEFCWEGIKQKRSNRIFIMMNDLSKYRIKQMLKDLSRANKRYQLRNYSLLLKSAIFTSRMFLLFYFFQITVFARVFK